MRPSLLRAFGLTGRVRSAAPGHEPIASTSAVPVEQRTAQQEDGELPVTPQLYVRSLLRRYGPMPIHKLFAVTRAAPLESPSREARFPGAPSHIIQSMRHLKNVLRASAARQGVNQITVRKLRDMSARVGVPDGVNALDDLDLPKGAKLTGDYVWLDGESFRRLLTLRRQLDGSSDAPAHKAWLKAPEPLAAPTSDPSKPPPSPWDFADETAAEFFAREAKFERDDAALFAADPQLRRTVDGKTTVSRLKAEARLAAQTARKRALAQRTKPLPRNATPTDRYHGEARPATEQEIRERAERKLKGARQLPPGLRRACVPQLDAR